MSKKKCDGRNQELAMRDSIGDTTQGISPVLLKMTAEMTADYIMIIWLVEMTAG